MPDLFGAKLADLIEHEILVFDILISAERDPCERDEG